MADKGWVKVHRNIEDCELWTSKQPFDRRSAWIDLILMVNHEDREILVGGRPLIVHRGQTFTSIRKLADKWHWSRDRVRRYFDTLSACGMTTDCATHNGTLLTVEKYSVYQYQRATESDTNKATDKATTRPPASPRSRHKQELKNVRTKKNERNKDGSADIPDVNPDGVPFQ